MKSTGGNRTAYRVRRTASFDCAVRSTHNDVRGEAGFTLMELLLAVTLMMIVMASCLGVFSMGIQIWRRCQGQSITERKAILFLEKAGEELGSMAHIKDTGEMKLGEGGFAKSVFKYQGNSRDMAFPVLFGSKSGGSGTVFGFGRTRYWWSSGAGEICRSVETVTDLYRRKEPECTPVISGIARAEFEYFIPKGISGELEWSEDWDGKTAPAAVRMTLELGRDPKTNNRGKIYEKVFLVPVGG